jgi:hypothetical protein
LHLRRWLTVVLTAAVCGVLGACGASGSDPSSGQSITLYSGQHEQTVNGLVTAFERQTGIHVNVRNEDEDTLANLIAVQGSHPPADVFYAENSPALEFLQDKSLLAPVQTSTLARTPAKYNSQAGDWVTVSARVSPEQIDLTNANSASAPDGTTAADGLPGRVTSYGYHGHDALLHVRPDRAPDDRTLVVRIAGGHHLPVGSPVTLRARGPVYAWPRD